MTVVRRVGPHRRWVQWTLSGLLAIVLAIGFSVATLGFTSAGERITRSLRHLRTPGLSHLGRLLRDPLAAVPLGDELRRQGYNECNTYDVLGLGPYSPYRRVYKGQIAIPQRGGHTADFGYDVLVHFHGHTAVMKTLAQVARGITYVGIDLGLGSGAYSDAFPTRAHANKLLVSITRALQEHANDPRAHIRHLALSAWSAGYGGVNELLKHISDDVDAVVLLDGLHAAWSPVSGRRGTLDAVTAGPIQPTLDFANQALEGQKLFIFTHSTIDPVSYPSTEMTAMFLEQQLGLVPLKSAPSADRYGLTSTVDRGGLHIWSYSGNDKQAHCSHIAHIEHVVRDVLEPEWNTPPMARDVAPTPAPNLGKPSGLARHGHKRHRAG